MLVRSSVIYSAQYNLIYGALEKRLFQKFKRKRIDRQQEVLESSKTLFVR